MKNFATHRHINMPKHLFGASFKDGLQYLFSPFLFILLFTFNSVQETFAQCVLSCPPMDPPREISISNDCLDTLNLGLLGVVASNCTDSFTIQILDENQINLGDTINSSMVNMTYMVVITNVDDNQICMTAIRVIDKQKPVINSCPADTSFACTFDISTYDGTADVDVTECSMFSVAQFDEVVFSASCQGDTVSKYLRTYVATDEYGNSTSCTQMLSLLKANLGDVTFPSDLSGVDALSCFPLPDTTPANTGAPMIDGNSIANGLFCNLSFTYQDVPSELCSGGYKIFRTFTVYDWCDNNNSSTGQQIIEVLDKTGPVVKAPLDLVISANSGMCLGSTMLPAADISEDCSDIASVRIQGPFGTMNTNGGFANNLPIGTYDIIYIARNDCDSTGRDTMKLTVLDNEPPTPVCHESVAIPVAANGEVIIPAMSLDAGSTDNCGPVYYKARRMTPPDGYDCYVDGNPNYLFDDIIKFCCEDIPNNNTMVILRVYDVQPDEGPVSNNHLEGRWNECMMEVQIQDKLPPTITCPSNLTVSCQFVFDPANLLPFGKIATTVLDQGEICLDDPGNPWTAGVECIGIDGFATDNCVANVRESSSVDIDSCGSGTILRLFTATDNGGFEATCEQRIEIINYTPFREGDITWPDDYSADDICDVDLLDPEDLPLPFSRPTWNEAECTLVSASKVDQVFDFSNTDQACFKIVRKWTVIDWCQFDSDGKGQWHYYQTLKSLNTVAPTITTELNDISRCTDDPNCGPTRISLNASATDDCSSASTLRWRYRIDLFNDLTIDETVGALSGGGVAFEYDFPIGTHRVLFTVNDKCNNTTTKEQIVNITSCNPPSPKCVVGLSTTLMSVDLDNNGTPDDGMVTIWATDFDGGSDHPCGLDFSLAFSDDVDDVSKIYSCADLGENVVELFVIDENGLSDFCTTFIRIQDNNSVCPDTGGGIATSGYIAGAIATKEDQDIENAMIYLNGSAAAPIPTDDQGGYAFTNIPFGSSYTIAPVKDGDDKNGISTLDLLSIQKHLLGIEPFDSPYKHIAADANNSGSITALDILELRKLILGINDEFQDNSSWRFIDSEYDFIDNHNPLAENWPEDYEINPLQSNMPTVDFIGIKIGDLNGTVVANAQDGPVVKTRSHVDPLMLLQKVDQSEVKVSALNINDFVTAQFSIEWDVNELPIVDVKVADAFSIEQFNLNEIQNGRISFAWFGDGKKMAKNQELISLIMRSDVTNSIVPAIELSSILTSKEAVNLDGQFAEIVINNANKGQFESGLELYQNAPNPFSQKTQISFRLPVQQDVHITFYDISGKRVHVEKISGVAGLNMVTIDANQIDARGVLIYELKTRSGLLTKRMIIE